MSNPHAGIKKTLEGFLIIVPDRDICISEYNPASVYDAYLAGIDDK